MCYWQLNESEKDLRLLKNYLAKDIEDLDTDHKETDFFDQFVSVIIQTFESQMCNIDRPEHVSDDEAKYYYISVQPVCNVLNYFWHI